MKHFVVAITRTCGAGGTSIAKRLADDLGVDLYDRKLLRLASEDSGINEALFANADETVKNSMLYRVSKKNYHGELIPPESDDFTSNDNLFNYQAKILRELADRESYIAIGRCADDILKERTDLIRVFIHAPADVCIRHEMERTGEPKHEVVKRIAKTDKYRAGYYKYHTGRDWYDVRNYDLCLDTGRFSYERCVEIIKQAIEHL